MLGIRPLVTRVNSMHIDRFRRFLPAIVMCLVVGAIVAAGHLFESSSSSPAMNRFRDAMHAPVFAVLTATLFLILRFRVEPRVALVGAIIGSVLTAFFGEFLQVFTIADASLGDVMNDATGIAGALLLVSYFDRQLWYGSRPIFKSVSLVCGLLLCGVAAYPALTITYAFTARSAALPQLLSFDHGWEQVFYMEVGGSAITRIPWQNDNDLIAVISMGRAKYSGIVIEPYNNWNGYDALQFTASSVSHQPRPLTLRIDDVDHNGQYADRFNQSFEIDHTPTVFVIPLHEISALSNGRKMRLDSVQSMIFFMIDTDGSEKIIINDIRLLTD